MKKMVSVITGILALCGVVKADVQKANALSSDESKKIAESLQVLKDSQVMTKDVDGRYDLDKDVIQKLKAEGYFKNKKSQVQTICGGHTK